MEPFQFRAGESPLIVSMPHVGTFIPPALAERMTPVAHAVPDTDWHVDRLYDFAIDLGASRLVATHSRYVVDLNRPPDGSALYPGASNTELCPLATFDDEPIYRPGEVPSTSEVQERIATYWRPYHARLAETIAAVKAKHGFALLFDA